MQRQDCWFQGSQEHYLHHGCGDAKKRRWQNPPQDAERAVRKVGRSPVRSRQTLQTEAGAIAPAFFIYIESLYLVHGCLVKFNIIFV